MTGTLHLLVHKRAIRQQPESIKRRGRGSIAEYVLTARDDRTPAVINLQLRLTHKGDPRNFSSCDVNLFDVAIRPFYRCSVQLFPCDPPVSRTPVRLFFGSEA